MDAGGRRERHDVVVGASAQADRTVMYGIRPVTPVLAVILGVQLLPMPAGGVLGTVRTGLLVIAGALTALWLTAVVTLVTAAAVVRLHRQVRPVPPPGPGVPGRHLTMEVSR